MAIAYDTLFLDRDGVINERIIGGYVRNIDEFVLLPGVIEGLKILQQHFKRTIIVTNQRGIGLGIMTEEDLQQIHEYMLRLFAAHGIVIDAIYYCPHDPDKKRCVCRKPRIGMGLKAKAQFLDLQFQKSVMVGDSEHDMLFGKRLGMYCVAIGKELLPYADAHYESLWHYAQTFLCLLP